MGIFAIFHPAPRADVMLEDRAQILRKYRYWRARILAGSIIGYAVFYFVRKNLPTAMPVMEKSLGITKSGLGLFLTLHGVLYGISKFFNGILGDRANARIFMAVGLLCSAALNFIFGFSSLTVVMGIVWMLNGWFQGMGFPPCARLLSHWFAPKELATKFSIWNSSHTIGGALIMIMGGYLATANWRLCFFVPATIAVICAIFLLFVLRDTPESLGLPPVETLNQLRPGFEVGAPSAETHAVEPIPLAQPVAQEDHFWRFLFHNVFSNPYIWLLSLANFFVYTIRYAFMDWGQTLLKESKGIQLSHGGWMMAAFEAAGAVGAIFGGWISDRFLGGRASRTCVVYMILCGASIWAFWKMPAQSHFATTGWLMATGFFIYGPQCLLAVVVANLASKRAAATAIGLTGIFGYASTVLSGWGLGWLVEHYSWDAGFGALIGVAAIGTILFICAWSAQSGDT